MRHVSKIIIDKEIYDKRFLEVLSKERYSIADFLETKRREISIGDIVTVSRSFQELSEINYFFSNLFGVENFIKEISESNISDFKVVVDDTKSLYYMLMEYMNGEMIEKTLAQYSPDFIGVIQRLIKTRHQIVHHGQCSIDFSKEKALDLCSPIFDFILRIEYFAKRYFKAKAKWS